MPQMPTTQSTRAVIAKNTLSQVVGRVVGTASTFVITIFLARLFGADGYGDFVKVTTFVAFFYLIADFGINAVFLQRNESWGTLLGLRMVIGIASVLTASIIALTLPGGATNGYTTIVRFGIVLFAPSIVLQAFITSANALFQKHLRYDLATIAVSLGAVATMLATWLVTKQSLASGGLLFAIVAQLVGLSVTAAASLWYANRLEKNLALDKSLAHIKLLAKASLPLGLTLLFNLIYFHVDSVILTVTRSTAEVGVYGLAYKAFEAFLVVPTFFMNALYPMMLLRIKAKAPQESFRSLSGLLWRSALLLLGSSILLSVVAWIGAPLLSLIKSDFLGSIELFRILILGLPIFFISSLVMWILITLKKQRSLAMIYAVGMMANIALNIFFVPELGGVAAAWITVGSEALILTLSAGRLAHLFFQKKIV